MILRPFKQDDLPSIAALVGTLWSIPDEQEFNWAYDPRPGEHWPHVYVAEDAGQIAGYARLDVNSFVGDANLAWLVVNVAPDYRGRGISDALAQLAMNAASDRKRTVLRTSVREDRERQMAFYQRHGFHPFMRAGDTLRVWTAPPHEFPLPEGVEVESLETFLKRPKAAAALEPALNAWNRDIHDPQLFGQAKEVSAENWLDTLEEAVSHQHSLVAWQGDQLYALVTFTPSENADELVLNLDFTQVTAHFRPAGVPQLPLALISQALERALDSGIKRVVFETQPHFPFFNEPLAELGGELVQKPPYVLLDRRA